MIERALAAGRTETDAVTTVDTVLHEQQRRIRRAADPDPLVNQALDQALLGRPTRGWSTPVRVVGAVAVLVVAVVTTVLVLRPGPASVAVPSLFGYDARTVTPYLRSRGLHVRLVEVRACLPGGELVTSRPRSGATIAPGGTVTVGTSVPASDSCVPRQATRDGAWQLVRYALLGGRSDAGVPRFAADVRVWTVAGASTRSVTLTPAQTADPTRLAQALPSLRSVAAGHVSTVSGLPDLEATSLTPSPAYCGLSRPRRVRSRPATRITITTTDVVQDERACPLTLDVYRRHHIIDSIVVYLPTS